jgi:hypothetical protein
MRSIEWESKNVNQRILDTPGTGAIEVGEGFSPRNEGMD